MSYSSEIKNFLASQDIKSKCCAAAELYALCLMNNGYLFKSKDEVFIRRIGALAAKASDFFVAGIFAQEKNKSNQFVWKVEISMKNEYDVDKIKNRFCCSDAFLKGCFIYSGYISAPDKPSRAEISFKNKDAFDICKYQLVQSGIKFNVAKRNEKNVIYIKSLSSVSDFLARIGAVGAMLEFENAIILKTYKNDANRAANCDNANLDKTVTAAVRQVRVFSDFMKTAAFENLSDELKEIAVLRVENETLSLKELGAMLTPTLSKSGVAHRLKKLENIALKSLQM